MDKRCKEDHKANAVWFEGGHLSDNHLLLNPVDLHKVDDTMEENRIWYWYESHWFCDLPLAVGIPTGYILGDLKRKKGLLNLCDTSDTDIAELIRKKYVLCSLPEMTRIFANGIDTPASQYLIARGYGGVYDSVPFCSVCSAYPAVIGDIQKVKITDDYERSGKAYTKLVYLEGELNDIIYVLNNISIEDMHVFALKDHYVGVEGSIVKYHDHYRATVKVHSVKRHKGLKDDHVAKSQTKKENKSAKSKSRTAALEGMSDNALSTVMDGGIRTSNDIQLSEDEKNMNDPEHVTQTLTDLFTKGVSTTTTGTKSENAIIEQIKHQVLKSTVEEVSKEHIQQVKENARKKHRLVEHVFDNNSNMTEIHTMYHSKDHSLDGLDGKYDNKQYSGTFEDNKQAEKSHFYSISGVMPTTPTGGNTPSFQQVMEEEEEDYDYILEDILGSPVPPDIKIIVHDKDAYAFLRRSECVGMITSQCWKIF